MINFTHSFLTVKDLPEGCDFAYVLTFHCRVYNHLSCCVNQKWVTTLIIYFVAEHFLNSCHILLIHTHKNGSDYLAIKYYRSKSCKVPSFTNSEPLIHFLSPGNCLSMFFFNRNITIL